MAQQGTSYIKSHGADINTSTDDYQKRLNVIAQQKKIVENEKKLAELEMKMDKILHTLGFSD